MLEDMSLIRTNDDDEEPSAKRHNESGAALTGFKYKADFEVWAIWSVTLD